jgi:hypothetical protein
MRHRRAFAGESQRQSAREGEIGVQAPRVASAPGASAGNRGAAIMGA